MRASRTMPACTILPVLTYEDVGAAITWLCETFGFTERWRVDNHRAQLAVGTCAFVVTERRSGDGACSLLVRVDDAERHHERARQCGARILQPPTDFPYGEKQYSAEDLGGHRWSFSETIADVAPEDWGGTSATS
jgi:uncharacterized glyoxalase superfamily protein PhnB